MSRLLFQLWKYRPIIKDLRGDRISLFSLKIVDILEIIMLSTSTEGLVLILIKSVSV